jgi:anti-sigma B factor antagonist
MKITDEEHGPHSILHVVGTLSVGDSARALQEHFDRVANERTGAVLLELSGMEHLDSTAVGVLVGGLKRFEAQGRRFFLVSPRERVASVFRITHLDSIFRVFPTLQEAIEAAESTENDEQTSER